MLTGTFLTAAAFFLLLASHPFVTYPLSLRVLRSVKGAAWARERLAGRAPALAPLSEPSFAICMSAYNEASCIEQKMANMFDLQATVRDCRIYIYADAPSDGPAQILARYADRAEIVIGAERCGKTHGLNQLMQRVTADVVVFTDANVILDREALQRLGSHFADPNVGCVCGNLIYVNAGESATSASGAIYWRIEEAIKQLESDTFSVIGADGSLFAIRRSCHHEPPDDIIDDFYVSMMILCDGYRVVRDPTALAFERCVTNLGDEFHRKVRIACQAFNVHRLIWPRVRLSRRMAYFYVSHRLLKWLTIYNVAIGAFLLLCALATVVSTTAITVLVALLLLAAAALLSAGSSMAQRGLAVLLAFTGAGWGVWRSIRGDRFQVWVPSTSARGSVVD